MRIYLFCQMKINLLNKQIIKKHHLCRRIRTPIAINDNLFKLTSISIHHWALDVVIIDRMTCQKSRVINDSQI